MGWDDFLTENPTFFCLYDKKDTFPEFGKSQHNERFVFLWDNSPPFAQNPSTSIFRFTQNSIKNEQTTTKPILIISRTISKCWRTCRSDNVKKPKL